jgi:hypothetical protein
MNLDTMTRDQLVEQADALGVEIPKGASKAAVRAAVDDALAQKQAAVTVPPVVGALTPDQRVLLASASDAEIEGVLADAAVPAWCKAEFTAELSRRTAAGRKSVIAEYLVTKGGRYCVPGYATTLPKDSVISALTHNLDDVRAQGIEIEPLAGRVEAYKDQLGFVRTRIVGG